MIKKIFLYSFLGLIFQGIYFPCAKTVADDDLPIDPRNNVDRIELCLDGLDYVSEVLEIAALGSTSEQKLTCVYLLSILSKVGCFFKEYYKLDGGFYAPDLACLHAPWLFIIAFALVRIPKIRQGILKGSIDSMGVFKLFSGLIYGGLAANYLLERENIIQRNKARPIQNLNRKKLIQLCWLSINKFMPFMICTLIHKLKYGGELGLHTLADTTNPKVKAKSPLYKYCSIIFGISECVRKYCQHKLINRHEKPKMVVTA